MYYLAWMKDKEDVKVVITKFEYPFIDVLKANSSYITDGERNAYFLPYWFEEHELGLVMHSLGKLPRWIETCIKDMRDGE